MRFNDLTLPLSVSEFCQDYLDKQWLHLTGVHERFERLVPWTDLNGVLSRLRLFRDDSRMVLIRNGVKIPSTNYVNALGDGSAGSLLRAGRVERELADGATLVVNRVEEIFPEVRILANDTEAILDRHVGVNLYCAFKSEGGFNLHWDDHDTLIVQVHGRKAWRVYGPTCEYPHKDYRPSPSIPKSEPVWDGILEAGSILYIPRGWWHVALPLAGPTLHVTFGLSGITGEHILDWLHSRLLHSPQYRRYVPHPSNPDEVASHVSHLKEVVLEALSYRSVQSVKQFVDSRLPRLTSFNLPLIAESPAPQLTPKTLLMLAGIRHLASTDISDTISAVSAFDGEWCCQPQIAAILGTLQDREAIVFSDLARGLTASEVAELKRVLIALVLAGIIVTRESAEVTGKSAESKAMSQLDGPVAV